jgi:hypothetical protein
MPALREKASSSQEAFLPAVQAVLQAVAAVLLPAVQAAVQAASKFVNHVSGSQAEKVKKERNDQENGEGDLAFS